ncbi:TPA: acyltransferase [Enterobacter ludwigii]|uniref:acyltransferase family protein n=1 Tax=Enterobacter ludwigii TaxID=299767 RepID=UPI002813679E|nr:acyltransferase [Enterobacter ludwigii]
MRIDKIDFLRFLGLSLIILAHVQPPLWLAQLRNFDVPLMFMVMGMSFYVTEHRHSSKIKYIISRFRRLVLPTWIFFFFFFAINECIALIFAIKNFTYPQGHIITSFTLSSGLGFVWVIRLFFIISSIAIFLPKRLLNAKLSFLLIVFTAAVVINSQFKEFYKILDEMNKMLLIGSYVSNIIPYLLCFLIGYKIMCLSKEQTLQLIILTGSVFIALALHYYLVTNSFTPTQFDKYPAGIYYLYYAFFMCSLIYFHSDIITMHLQNTFTWKYIKFISENSIWIYLWHIPFILMCHKFSLNFVIGFFTTYTMALFFVYLQSSLVGLITKRIKNKHTSKVITSIFTG